MATHFHKSRHMQQRGQAMIELIIVAGLVLVPLFLAIPMLGKYLDLRMAAVQAARYAAWERSVWFGGSAVTPSGFGGFTNSWQANEKDDATILTEFYTRGLSQASQTASQDAFSSSDGTAGGFRNGSPKVLWTDRTNQSFLAWSNKGSNSLDINDSNTLTNVLGDLIGVASVLGSFTLDTKAQYTAKVSINVKGLDTDQNGLTTEFKATTPTSMNEQNVLIANAWSADGPDDLGKTSVLTQTQGLVPFAAFNSSASCFDPSSNKGAGDTIRACMTLVMNAVKVVGSFFLPELSKIEPGIIKPDEVPEDRLK